MKKIFLLLLVLQGFIANSQSMDRIRRVCFYNIPFDTTTTFEEASAYLDARKDSFLLVNDTTYVHDGSHVSFNRIYTTRFSDPFFGVPMELEIHGYSGDGNKINWLGDVFLYPLADPEFSKKTAKKIFRKINKETKLRRYKNDRFLRKEYDGWDIFKVFDENGIGFYNSLYKDFNELKLVKKNL